MKKNFLLWILTLLFCSIEAQPLRKKRRQLSPTSSSRLLKKTPTTKKITKSAPTTPSAKQSLTQAIHKAIQQADKKTIVGIKISTLKDNKVLFQKNPDRLFTPASNTKIFTAGAAFHILGPDYTFETDLLTDKQTGNKINNLYIRGSGDPSLKLKDLEKLVTTLKSRSIKEISGSLIIDKTCFDASTAAPGS